MTKPKKPDSTDTKVLPKAERRQIENEMIFRRANEKVGDDLDELDELHILENVPELMRDTRLLVPFLCECSDEDCMETIFITLDDYQEIHANRNTFIVKPEHQVEHIEEVVHKEKDYFVVHKNNSTPEPGKFLNETTINND